MNIVYYNKIYPENIFFEIKKCKHSNNIGIFQCGYFFSNLDKVYKSETIRVSYSTYSTTVQHYFVFFYDCDEQLYNSLEYKCPITIYDEED